MTNGIDVRHVFLSAVVFLGLGLGPAAQSQTANAQVMAPITRFMEAFNKGDIEAAAATHAADADLVIVDEVTPYVWRGSKAFHAWAGDLDADAKKRGVTDQQVSIGAATRVETDGTGAYVIVPSVYTFKEKGIAMRASAQMTFTLKKGASGWLIHGWTWTGPKPRKVAAGA
jgi:ketosteroid isomerase-like protein